jgi:hypothetical protein
MGKECLMNQPMEIRHNDVKAFLFRLEGPAFTHPQIDNLRYTGQMN